MDLQDAINTINRKGEWAHATDYVELVAAMLEGQPNATFFDALHYAANADKLGDYAAGNAAFYIVEAALESTGELAEWDSNEDFSPYDAADCFLTVESVTPDGLRDAASELWQ